MKSLAATFFAVAGLLLAASFFSPDNAMTWSLSIIAVVMLIAGCVFRLGQRKKRSD